MFVLIVLTVITLCNCETTGFTDELAREYMFVMSAAAYSDKPGECMKKFKNATVYNQTYAECTGNCSGFTAVMHEKQAIVLSFRYVGTTDMQQLFAEIKESTFKEWVGFYLMGDYGIVIMTRNYSNWTHGGRVSKYFHDAFLSLWNGGMEKDFKNLTTYYQYYEIWVTGHSRGGALATLAASVVDGQHNQTNVKLVTFGQPRVGDEKFAEEHHKMVKLHHWPDVSTNSSLSEA
ncbi:hypothetical protein RB195_008705 [Necator americanus]|uniref:Fungal lipase-type domain-containing protein n=1 Tax=Necator americanus TaxID=51031 RepID=A0ABR1CPY4_NECAM